MDGDILDPDGARERLAAWKGRIDELAAHTQAMGERLKDLRVTARDPGGMGEVTVDSTGAVVDLELTEQIQRSAPSAVAQAILATIRSARATLAQRSQEVIAETMGAESTTGRAIAEKLGRQFGGEPAERSDDDEHFDSRSPLRRD